MRIVAWPSPFLLGLTAVCFLSPALRAGEAAPGFNRDIRPILAENCFACHGPDAAARKARLRLDQRDAAVKAGAVVPGNPDKSELVERIFSDEPSKVMPPPRTKKTLTAAQKELLKRWIAAGAEYQAHWAYLAPVRPEPPAVKEETRVRNPIDRFLLARLEREGLAPSPEADRETLIRRASLDLTGLPPTPAEVDQFVNDKDADAYERLVDRLLGRESFGEHWARKWLDLARYADSAGYANDPPRTIWLYRDYVIRSFNENKPFDQFTVEQIAGDLLPNPTDQQLIATAFHRNTMTNTEGGTNPEEFRNVAVIDRVNTTMTVWMGTSIACCQCHDHKYDPLTNKEYFQLFAIFNNSADANRGDEAPVFNLFTDEQKARRAKLETEIAAVEAPFQARSPALAEARTAWEHDAAAAAKLPDNVRAALAVAAEKRGAAERDLIADYYVHNIAPELEAERGQLAALKKQLAEIAPATVPIMRELPANQRRKTNIQLRGNYLALGDEVREGVPAVFPPLLPDAPRDRLALARWLVDAKNPLTARVLANRLWEDIFGVGIVRTSEDFGTQGEAPVHPELLDWLAAELIQDKWDVKRFLKLLVTSAAYRQSSRVTAELRERDPDNRLLARGPRFRLSAEMVRDQALAVSGLLSRKVYGPSVKPPRPSAGLSAAFGGGLDWQTSAGEDRYRRALYTEWRRTSPYPSMATFDAPNREVCTIRRTRTNTPLQVLVTLNDPVYVEAAQALARRMAALGTTPADKVQFGFRLCVARAPRDAERERLVQLYDEAHAEYARAPEKAVQLATNPLGPLPQGADAADLAAWTTVANVLLNLDETLMKR